MIAQKLPDALLDRPVGIIGETVSAVAGLSDNGSPAVVISHFVPLKGVR